MVAHVDQWQHRHREPNHPWTRPSFEVYGSHWCTCVVRVWKQIYGCWSWWDKTRKKKKKQQSVAGWIPNSWLFTCWLLCHFSRESFSLCDRHSVIPHDKLDCSSSEPCWIILVLSIASPAPEIFLYCCLWAISLDGHNRRYSICSVTPKANEMC